MRLVSYSSRRWLGPIYINYSKCTSVFTGTYPIYNSMPTINYNRTMALAFWFGFRQFVRGHIDNVGTIVIVLMSVMMV